MDKIKLIEVNIEKLKRECPHKPSFDKVVIKRLEIMESGLIVMPSTSREKELDLGYVVAVGEDVTRWEVGDLVEFGKYVGGKLLAFRNEEQYILMFDKDCICSYDKKHLAKVTKQHEEDNN